MYEDKEDKMYCYPGTNTLINKLDIKDPEILNEYETSIVALKLMALVKQGITGSFDFNHYISIHRFLFEDIYPFAGVLRNENIYKNYFQFAQFEYIKPELERLFNELKNENYLRDYDKENLAKKLAYYWAELNVLHPFREGNGRATREFLRQLALKNDYELNYQNVSFKELFDASIKSIADTTDLEKLIYKCLDKI